MWCRHILWTGPRSHLGQSHSCGPCLLTIRLFSRLRWMVIQTPTAAPGRFHLSSCIGHRLQPTWADSSSVQFLSIIDSCSMPRYYSGNVSHHFKLRASMPSVCRVDLDNFSTLSAEHALNSTTTYPLLHGKVTI